MLLSRRWFSILLCSSFFVLGACDGDGGSSSLPSRPQGQRVIAELNAQGLRVQVLDLGSGAKTPLGPTLPGLTEVGALLTAQDHSAAVLVARGEQGEQLLTWNGHAWTVLHSEATDGKLRSLRVSDDALWLWLETGGRGELFEERTKRLIHGRLGLVFESSGDGDAIGAPGFAPKGAWALVREGGQARVFFADGTSTRFDPGLDTDSAANWGVWVSYAESVVVYSLAGEYRWLTPRGAALGTEIKAVPGEQAWRGYVAIDGYCQWAGPRGLESIVPMTEAAFQEQGVRLGEAELILTEDGRWISPAGQVIGRFEGFEQNTPVLWLGAELVLWDSSPLGPGAQVDPDPSRPRTLTLTDVRSGELIIKSWEIPAQAVLLTLRGDARVGFVEGKTLKVIDLEQATLSSQPYEGGAPIAAGVQRATSHTHEPPANLWGDSGSLGLP